jgi:flagella basal body P-ring formation protein FlgA
MLSALLVLACCISAPQEVTISTDSITLGELIPFNASDSRAAIQLGFAPNPGLARRFLRDELFTKISAAGFSTEDLRLPETILVRRQSQTLDRDHVMRTITDAFVRQYPGANVQVLSVEVPATEVGTGNIEMTASIPPRVDPSGPIYVKLDLRGISFARTIYVRTLARIETPQPVVVRPVAAQSVIAPEDVEWKPTALQGGHDIVTSLDAIQGMVAKRNLEPGTTLSTDLLYMPVYVHKGDAVTVRATAGTVTVSATMRAKEAGKFGESILVEHLSGAGTTTARVVGPRTLEAIQGAK